jgi:hypothetical protein
MERWWTNKLGKKKTNKYIKKNSRFRNKRISVLVVLALHLQHPILVLLFKH